MYPNICFTYYNMTCGILKYSEQYFFVTCRGVTAEYG